MSASSLVAACSQCTKVFDTHQKQRKHVQRCHGEKTEVCPDCGKSFALLHKLKIHMLSHNTFGEFLCALCGKRFKRRDKLREHIIRMHVHAAEKERQNPSPKPRPKIKRYKFIKVCRPESVEVEDTSSSIKLKRHKFQKLKSPESYGKGYQCHVCDIEFRRRGILVNHLSRIHPEVSLKSIHQLNTPVLQPAKSFKCHYCEKSYQSNGGRKTHIKRSHPTADPSLSNRFMDSKEAGYTEVVPKSCSQCPRQFLTNAKLLQHQRKFHPNMPEGPL